MLGNDRRRSLGPHGGALLRCWPDRELRDRARVRGARVRVRRREASDRPLAAGRLPRLSIPPRHGSPRAPEPSVRGRSFRRRDRRPRPRCTRERAPGNPVRHGQRDRQRRVAGRVWSPEPRGRNSAREAAGNGAHHASGRANRQAGARTRQCLRPRLRRSGLRSLRLRSGAALHRGDRRGRSRLRTHDYGRARGQDLGELRLTAAPSDAPRLCTNGRTLLLRRTLLRRFLRAVARRRAPVLL